MQYKFKHKKSYMYFIFGLDILAFLIINYLIYIIKNQNIGFVLFLAFIGIFWISLTKMRYKVVYDDVQQVFCIMRGGYNSVYVIKKSDITSVSEENSKIKIETAEKTYMIPKTIENKNELINFLKGDSL